MEVATLRKTYGWLRMLAEQGRIDQIDPIGNRWMRAFMPSWEKGMRQRQGYNLEETTSYRSDRDQKNRSRLDEHELRLWKRNLWLEYHVTEATYCIVRPMGQIHSTKDLTYKKGKGLLEQY